MAPILSRFYRNENIKPKLVPEYISSILKVLPDVSSDGSLTPLVEFERFAASPKTFSLD